MNITNSLLCSFWQALCKVSSEHSHLLENTRSFVPLPSDAVPHICCSALSFAASFPETMKDSVECLLKPLGTNRASFLALVPRCLIKMLHLSLQKCFMLWTPSLIICYSLVRFLNRIHIVSPSVLQAGRKYLPACLKQPFFNWTTISSWLATPESWWSKSTGADFYQSILRKNILEWMNFSFSFRSWLWLRAVDFLSSFLSS